MLFLNEKEIKSAVTLNEMMDAIEEALSIFRSGEFYMPERFNVEYKNKNLLYMPCITQDIIGTKMLTLFSENQVKKLPLIYGLMMLNDYETGKPLAILDAQALTALRTGAVGGVGMQHFAYPDSETVGVVGCGVQGFHQILYACDLRPIKHIYLYDAFNKDLSDYINRLQQALAPKNPEITVTSDTTELLNKSQIVITTSPATEPVLPNRPELLEGKCFIAIGSWKPNMREIPDAIWQVVNHVYTELPYACEESGDLSQPLADGILTMDRVKYMGDYLARKAAGETIPLEKTRYFKSVGMGLFDLQTANLIYKKALSTGIGQKVTLSDN
ncbi:MAG: ornithine cyclodeaminase family protein [Bacillota bacterium]|jgi:ornithine cyclodeaminase/alanine dehydrogenase-like protein (mu-crystallin family)